MLLSQHHSYLQPASDAIQEGNRGNSKSQESWDINILGKEDLALFGKGLNRKVVVGTKKNLRNNCMISLSKR